MPAPLNLRAMLQRPIDDAPRPVTLPQAFYIGTIKGHSFGASRNANTPYVRFELIPEGLADGYDADLTGIDLSEQSLRKDYYITKKALYRLTDMLKAVLPEIQDGVNYDEILPSTSGLRVQFEVIERESPTTGETFNEVNSITAAP